MSRELRRAVWDPAQYLNFTDQRSRPFFDLVGRVGATAPSYVVDLGCGPGQLTATLSQRWPGADVEGIDSSAEMIAAADQMLAELSSAACDTGPGASGRPVPSRLRFGIGDVASWKSERPVDVLVSNAVLQWVPGHLEMIPRWVGALADSGWLAFQLPGNFDQPSHAILRELAMSPRWQERLDRVTLNRQASDPADYLDLLARLGLSVDAWETTYLHVLAGRDPVTEWYKGTGLRPVLTALSPDDGAAFLAEYSEQIRIAYPAAGYGTVFPFRRVFVVAHKA